MNQIKVIEKVWKTGFAALTILALAFGGLFLNLGAADAHGNPNLTADLRVSEVENPNQGWVDGTLNTQAGRTVKFDVEIHNTVVETNAHNVRARVNLPSSVSTSHNISLTAWAENSNTASDSVTVAVPSPGAEIRYIAGSSRLTWDENGDGTLDYNQTPIPDDIVSANGVRIGDQSGCNEFIIKINFLAELVAEELEPSPSPSPSPAAGGITNTNINVNNNENINENKVNIEVKNEQKQNQSQIVSQAAAVPAKQPETGVGVLGMTTMTAALPLGVYLARYRRRGPIDGDEDDLLDFARQTLSRRASKTS